MLSAAKHSYKSIWEFCSLRKAGSLEDVPCWELVPEELDMSLGGDAHILGFNSSGGVCQAQGIWDTKTLSQLLATETVVLGLYGRGGLTEGSRLEPGKMHH